MGVRRQNYFAMRIMDALIHFENVKITSFHQVNIFFIFILHH